MYKSEEERDKKLVDDKANLTNKDLKEVLLLMAIEEESMKILIYEISQSKLQDGLWYLDTSTSSHITCQR